MHQIRIKLMRYSTGRSFLGALTIIAVMCFFTINLLFAASNSGFEAENGVSLNQCAKVIQESGASGDGAVEFRCQDNNQKFRTCYPHAFCDPNGQPHTFNGVNIREVWDPIVTLTQMQRIKAKGFNSVRIALHWDQYQPSAGPNGVSNSRINALRNAVANAKAAGLYVVLSTIHGTGNGNCTGNNGRVPEWAWVKDAQGNCLGRLAAIQTNAKDYLQRIASEFANEPAVVAIDLANEVKPMNYEDNAALLKMYDKLIQYYREVDPHTSLMIESTGGDKLIPANDIVAHITDKSNIIYSYHDYYGGPRNANGTIISGCTATGYKTSGTICGNYTYENQNGYVYPSFADKEAHLVANLNMLADSRLRWPLYVGEYNSAEGLVNSVQWRKDMVAAFKKHNVSRALWDFYNKGYAEWQGNPPAEEMSATRWGNSNGTLPGEWKPWVDDLF